MVEVLFLFFLIVQLFPLLVLSEDFVFDVLAEAQRGGGAVVPPGS